MTDVKEEEAAIKSAEEDNEPEESIYTDPNGEFLLKKLKIS